MYRNIKSLVLTLGLLWSSVAAMASPPVDVMSDAEVSEYAIRMSELLDKIQDRHLCISDDVRCVRAEFFRHGVSYDDKEPVQKRLVIMKGSIH